MQQALPMFRAVQLSQFVRSQKIFLVEQKYLPALTMLLHGQVCHCCYHYLLLLLLLLLLLGYVPSALDC
jgi:hypothetical protein